ncbi:MAG: hypothetical protein LBQ16_06865, partial [Gracilibacteraceae bacterium]|nr:hypothetical protein [Gracilibacteraceae bacterium]
GYRAAGFDLSILLKAALNSQQTGEEISKRQRLRIECNETFVYSLYQAGFIPSFFEKVDGEYKPFRDLYDLDQLIDQALEPFKNYPERVPLHKKLGE